MTAGLKKTKTLFVSPVSSDPLLLFIHVKNKAFL